MPHAMGSYCDYYYISAQSNNGIKERARKPRTGRSVTVSRRQQVPEENIQTEGQQIIKNNRSTPNTI